MYDSHERDEFDYKWREVLETLKTCKHIDWFEHLFEKKHMWVPAFVKDQFWAGMSTTQRSEGMNAFFDKYVNSRTSLKSFVQRYDSALHAKWEKERQEDFRCRQLRPNLITGCGFERQFADIYTMKVFYQYQKEIKFLTMCFCEIISSEAQYTLFAVRQLTNPHIFKVFVENDTQLYKCSCRLFEFRGIVCRHALCVYRQLGAQYLPNDYVLSRWRKDYVRSHVMQTVPDLPVLKGMSTYDATYTSANNLLLDLVEVAAQSNSLPRLLIMALQKVKSDLLHSYGQELPIEQQVDDYDNTHSDRNLSDNSLKDPPLVSCKGRPKSRSMKGGLEKKTKKIKKRRQTRKSKNNECEKITNQVRSHSLQFQNTTSLKLEYAITVCFLYICRIMQSIQMQTCMMKAHTLLFSS